MLPQSWCLYSNGKVIKISWLHPTSPCLTLHYLTGHGLHFGTDSFLPVSETQWTHLIYCSSHRRKWWHPHIEQTWKKKKKNLHFLEHWQLGLATNVAAISRVPGSVSDARALPGANVTHWPHKALQKGLGSTSCPTAFCSPSSYMFFPSSSTRDWIRGAQTG